MEKLKIKIVNKDSKSYGEEFIVSEVEGFPNEYVISNGDPVWDGCLIPIEYCEKVEKNYYERELEKIPVVSTELSVNLQISNGITKTKWMTLNKESAKAIIEYLESNYLV